MHLPSFKANCKALGLTTESDELDWIMQQCDCPILFYDKMQVVGPSGINIEGFDEKMKLGMIGETIVTVLQEMHGKDFSEYGFHDACIKAEMQLQTADKDRSYERGVRIR